MTTLDRNETRLEASRNIDAGFIRRLFRRWGERRRERATLIELSRMQPHFLRDMGIEPGDVHQALDGDRGSLLFDPAQRKRF